MLLVATLETWLTPLWLLGLGAGLGLLLTATVFGVIALCGAHPREVAQDTLRKGVMLPVMIAAGVLTAICLLGTIRVDAEPLLISLTRLAQAGEETVDIEVPGKTDRLALDLTFRRRELRHIEIKSDANLILEANTEEDGAAPTQLRLNADEPLEWRLGSGKYILFRDDVQQMYASNPDDKPAHLTMVVELGVEHPQVEAIPWIAASLPLLFLVCFGLRICFPRTAAIALTTSSEAVSQPLFLMVLVMGAFALLVFIYIPYNTFGDDVLMLKGMGMTIIKVLAVILAMWTASVAVAEEIEGRTALTVMSKPISRQQFIIGKFLGLIGPIFLVFLFLGIVYLGTVSYKVVYDARESARVEPVWQVCNYEMMQTIPGLVLGFFEAVILAAISIAISTRLGMLPNLIIISSIYVLGHLMPPLVQSSIGSFPIVAFLGQLIATVLPVLDHFDVQAAVSGRQDVPWQYVAWALLYTTIYCAIALLAALALFEDRDVA